TPVSLTSGTNFGPYQFLAPIGAGGMGEVYRARDTKLKRDIALKVLPEAFASDAGRMARFQREAEVLASLNAPAIAHIYVVEERALAMELKAKRCRVLCRSTQRSHMPNRPRKRWNTPTSVGSFIGT